MTGQKNKLGRIVKRRCQTCRLWRPIAWFPRITSHKREPTCRLCRTPSDAKRAAAELDRARIEGWK